MISMFNFRYRGGLGDCLDRPRLWKRFGPSNGSVATRQAEFYAAYLAYSTPSPALAYLLSLAKEVEPTIFP
jgi:hypothetical protein